MAPSVHEPEVYLQHHTGRYEHYFLTLRKLAQAIYREILQKQILKIHCKRIDCFKIFAQNKDCGYMLEPPRLTSTRNLCFGS